MSGARSGLLILVAVALAGCWSRPPPPSVELAPFYVSPVVYQNQTCGQLAISGQAITTRAAGLIGWDGPKVADEWVNYQAHMLAIEQASIQKQCGIQFQRIGPK